MHITGIKAGKNKRYLVYGDEQFLFSLYGRELKKYHIREEDEIEDTLIQFVLQEVVFKRAKERALFLLERRPFSTCMLREKLNQSDYPETVVEQVILFLQQYHYLDDAEYVSMYVDTYSGKKSRKQIVYDLVRKGISKDIIDLYFEESEYSERECFEKQFEKYTKGRDLKDRMVKQKIFRYFYGKGFQISLIEEALKR